LLAGDIHMIAGFSVFLLKSVKKAVNRRYVLREDALS